MSVLTYFTQAIVKDSITEVDGKTLSSPSLLIGEGGHEVYVVNVDIGQKDPLYNVEVSRGNKDLFYADVGSPVRLRRTASGLFQVVGFSKEMPGTFIRIPVNLETFEFGVIEDLTITTRKLTYEELMDYGGYGVVAYGAVALYKGTVLQEIV